MTCAACAGPGATRLNSLYKTLILFAVGCADGHVMDAERLWSAARAVGVFAITQQVCRLPHWHSLVSCKVMYATCFQAQEQTAQLSNSRGITVAFV